MSPRAFDPEQRARDFPRMPSPRRLLLSPERRLDGLERAVSVAIDLAIQPQATTPIEILTALPEATNDDIGQDIIVQLAGETVTSRYTGILLADGTVVWQLIGLGPAGVSSPEFSFVQSWAAGGAITCLCSTSTHVYYQTDTAGQLDVRRLEKATGTITGPVTGFPDASDIGQGIHAESDSALWVTIPVDDAIQYWDGSAPIIFSPTANDYWGIWFDPTSGSLFATDMAGNEAKKLNKTTLAVISTFATTGLSGPKGIATDSNGNVYIADTGNHRIRKYDSSLAHVLDFGSSGAGDGQLSSPLGLAVDSGNRLYVADSGNDRVQTFDALGNYLGKFGASGAGDAQLDNPVDVHVSGTDIVAADRGNSRISRWTRS